MATALGHVHRSLARPPASRGSWRVRRHLRGRRVPLGGRVGCRVDRLHDVQRPLRHSRSRPNVSNATPHLAVASDPTASPCRQVTRLQETTLTAANERVSGSPTSPRLRASPHHVDGAPTPYAARWERSQSGNSSWSIHPKLRLSSSRSGPVQLNF